VCRLALLLLLVLATSARAQLELRFLDVGQGDAILLREGGRAVLIDAGPSGKIVPELRKLGVSELDLLVATHNHEDHIGGMPAVMRELRIRNYMDNGIPHPTGIYRRTIDAVRSGGTRYLLATERTITLGAARLRVLPIPHRRKQNDSSIGLLVEYGSFRALLTGDAEQSELHFWLTHARIPRVQVVKVSHHGAYDGTTREWVAATQPKLAVISVGTPNSYHHPSIATVRRWEAFGARIRRTDQDGNIVVRANPDGTFQETHDGRRGEPRLSSFESAR
jgi:beta-lactamase superfamily II metal-dependent hydrolase